MPKAEKPDDAMIGDFGDRNLENRECFVEAVTPENWTKHRAAQEVAAEHVIKHIGAKLETHKVLILVDLQGMYLGLHKWLRDQDFPIEGGLVLSRLATFQILDVFERIKRRILQLPGEAPSDFEDVLAGIKQTKPEKLTFLPHGLIRPESTYLRFVPQFELFYAPAPIEQLEWQLRKQAKAGSTEAMQQLSKLKMGVVGNKRLDERDYAAYDDFVRKLKANPEYSKSAQGFFSYYVGPKGLTFFDEKAVDTHIVIRAMDALYNNEADSICIASSDQDFIPLHDRARGFGVHTFQADLAKFQTPDRMARKFKALGENFLGGRIDATWLLSIIFEAAHGPLDAMGPAMYFLTEKEFVALCKIHNSMNEVHIAPDFQADGRVSLRLSRPLK